MWLAPGAYDDTQESPCYGNSRKHTNNNTYAQCHCEAAYHTGTQTVEDSRSDEAGYIRVFDGFPSMAEAFLHCAAFAQAAFVLVDFEGGFLFFLQLFQNFRSVVRAIYYEYNVGMLGDEFAGEEGIRAGGDALFLIARRYHYCNLFHMGNSVVKGYNPFMEANRTGLR